MQELLGLPAAASSHAGDIDQMIVLIHWLMAVLFVGWGAFFVFVLFRFRRRANPKADYAGAKGKLSKGIEVAIVSRKWSCSSATPSRPGRSVCAAILQRRAKPRSSGGGEQFAWNAVSRRRWQIRSRDVTLVSADNRLGLDRNDPTEGRCHHNQSPECAGGSAALFS